MNRLANCLLIVTCVLVSGNLVFKIWRSSAPSIKSRSISYADNEKVANTVDPRLLGPSGSLLVYTVSNCKYCTESMAALRRISSLSQRHQMKVVALSAEDLEMNRFYLSRHGLTADDVVSASTVPKLVATPTTIVIDNKGIVRGVWQGQITENGESAISRALLSSR